jgi:polyhydroxyalkanoate synthesis regulator phasin
MATMLDRMREGLIWSYAALSLAEEQQLKSRQWWEQEGLRLKEEARARLDGALRDMEERRTQRREHLGDRVRERLGVGIATKKDVASLQARVDALAAEVERLRGQEGGAATPETSPPDAPPTA